MWPRKKEATHNVTVLVDQFEVDEAVAKVEATIARMGAAEKRLNDTIKRAKIARTELETTIQQSKKTGRGRW